MPFALFILAFLAYGLLIHQLGFYWDDWPWLFWSHYFGKKGLLLIDQGYRPLSGLILWLGGLISGDSAAAWQVVNLVYRWFSAAALWWALYKLFPGWLEKTVWIAFVFLVYPGFGQQFISINSSRHILPMGFFFLSLGLMVWAIQEKRRYWLFTGLALVTSLASALATDYFFGLELLRPLILWLAINGQPRPNSEKFKKVIIYWLPYLILFMPLVAWRYVISPTANYEVELVQEFSEQPVSTLASAAGQLLRHIFDSAVEVWTRSIEMISKNELRFRRLVMYWGLLGLTLVLSLLYLFRLRQDGKERGLWKNLLVLGLAALALGALPFLAARIPLGLNFPSDRTTLPMALGASLVFVGLVELAGRKRAVMIILVSLAIALGAGSQFVTAARFEEDWDVQQSFIRQLMIRIPNLQPETAILYQYTTALQDFHSTSNSLTPLINMLYAPEFKGSPEDLLAAHLPYYFMDLRRDGEMVQDALGVNEPIEKEYKPFNFKAPPGHVLAVQFAPPWCLQVLSPGYARLYPHLPPELAAVVAYSNPYLIGSGKILLDNPIRKIFKEEAPGWCEYYQMAEKARMEGDWEKVAEIGDEAFARAGYPQQPSERLPFILGYGYQERWQRAAELTNEMVRRDKNTIPLLCRAWSELFANAPQSQAKDRVIAEIQTTLDCQP